MTLTDEVIPTAEEILVEAIESAPNGFLDVGGDMGKLCAKHPQLRDALRAAGGLTRFCETHGALKRNGCTVLLSKPPDEANHSNDVRRVDAQHMQTRVRQQAKDARRRMAVEAEQKRKELEEAPAKAINACAVEPLPLVQNSTTLEETPSRGEVKVNLTAISSTDGQLRPDWAKASAQIFFELCPFL